MNQPNQLFKTLIKIILLLSLGISLIISYRSFSAVKISEQTKYNLTKLEDLLNKSHNWQKDEFFSVSYNYGFEKVTCKIENDADVEQCESIKKSFDKALAAYEDIEGLNWRDFGWLMLPVLLGICIWLDCRKGVMD